MNIVLQRRSLAPSQVAKRRNGGDSSSDEDWDPEQVTLATRLSKVTVAAISTTRHNVNVNVNVTYHTLLNSWLSEQNDWYHFRKENEEKEMGIAEKTWSPHTENPLHS